MTPAELEAHFANWTPTSENINALPLPLRTLIMRLMANTDPAGELRRAMVWEMRAKALEKMIAQAPEGHVDVAVAEDAFVVDELTVATYTMRGKRVRLVEVADERG